MKQFIEKHKKAVTGIAAAMGIGIIALSFQDSPFISHDYELTENCRDTVPDRNYEGSMKMKDFDKLIDQMDNTFLDVEKNIKNIDIDKMMKGVEASLASIDMDKIMKDVSLSLKNIDVDKILRDVQLSLKDIKTDEISKEVESALKEAQTEIAKAKKEIAEVDTKSIARDLEAAKKEIEKSKAEFGKIDMTKIMDEAREGIDKAKAELKQIKQMFLEMEKDGLIDTKKGFSIEYKNKELLIDGKKQTEEVTNKYRHYFKDDHFKMKIDKD